MELKPGYKQTDVGVIPVEWQVTLLADLCARGGLVRGPFGGSLTKDMFVPKGYKVYEQRNAIYRDTDIGAYFIDSTKFNELARFSVLPGDYIVSCSGTIGRIFRIPEGASPGVINQALLLLRLDSRIVDGEFFYQVFGYSRFQQSILDNTHGGAMQNLVGMPILKMIGIALPPLAEQRTVAAALGDVDALLGALDRLIAKKRDLKQAAMQQLLTGQTRLPGFHGEWSVKRLGDLGRTYGGLTGKTKEDFGEGAARYITFMNVMTNVVIDSGTFEQVRVSPQESQNRAVKGDLFFNGSSETPEEVALCAVLSEEVLDVYLNSFCFGFRFRDGAEADGLFLAYYFRSAQGRELMKSLAQGSTRYNLSKSALLKSPLRLPPQLEQTAIAQVLADMDAELAGLNQRRDKTRALKQAMMQELLTGKTRLV